MREQLLTRIGLAVCRGAGAAWAVLGGVVLLHAGGAFRFREAWGLGLILVALAASIGWAALVGRAFGLAAAAGAGAVAAFAAVVPIDRMTERLVPAWAMGLVFFAAGLALAYVGARRAARA